LAQELFGLLLARLLLSTVLTSSAAVCRQPVQDVRPTVPDVARVHSCRRRHVRDVHDS